MTSRCCWLIQPASATRTNCSGCDSHGMALRLAGGHHRRLGPPDLNPTFRGKAEVFGRSGFWTIRGGVQRISIENDALNAVQETVASRGEIPSDLHHPGLVRLTRDPGNRHATALQLHNKSRAVDMPFIATVSTDKAWVIASFTRTAGNVWSNPELTCQHVDPQTSLSPGQRATIELKLLTRPCLRPSSMLWAHRKEGHGLRESLVRK